MAWNTKMRRAERRSSPRIPRNHALWLAAAIVSSQLPHLSHLPLWITVVGLAAVGLRVALECAGRPQPKGWWVLAAGLGTALGIYLQFDRHLIGRDSCVALLYILVGLKLLEARQRRDETLLLCLAAFLTLTEFIYAQSVMAAIASVPALLLIPASLVGTRNDEYVTPGRTVIRESVVCLVHGIPLAFVFFFLFPRISGPLWGMPSDNLGRPGLSESMAPGTIRELSLSDEVAFRVDFEGEPPPSPALYWRGPVLSSYDGQTWRTRPSLRGALRTNVNTRAATSYTVALEPNNQRYYLALDLPISLPFEAHLTPQFELVGLAPITRAIRYRQVSLIAAHYAGNPERGFNVQLPANGNPRARAWAQQLRGRYADDRSLANAVLDQFRTDNFTYTMEANIEGDDSIDDFLFHSKRGFCEHYAGSFVFVLRAAGIPARIVTGYQGGEMNEIGSLHYMIVRQSDAHAWAEAWIGGQWERFDPTAAVAPARIEHGIGAALRHRGSASFFSELDDAWFQVVRLPADALTYGWQRWVVGYNSERQRSLWSDAGLGDAQPWKLIIALTMTATVCALLVTGFVLIHWKKGDPLIGAWERFCRRLSAAGLPKPPEEGPLAYAQRAAARWPTHAELLREFVNIYCSLRYGNAGKDTENRTALAETLARLPTVRELARKK